MPSHKPTCEIHPDTTLICPRCIRAKRTSYDPAQLAKAGRKGGRRRVPKGFGKPKSAPDQ